MNKKLLIALGVAGVAVLAIAGAVFAGSSLDRGNLETFPVVGTINYYAWIEKYSVNGIPTEIMTEDSYNSNDGPDRGYYQPTTGNPRWRIQIVNFDPNGIDGDRIKLVFGGINILSGNLWYYDIYPYVYNTESITEHGVVGTKTPGAACPRRYPVQVTTSGNKFVSFAAEPNRTYQIYRSQNASGFVPDNGYSDGRYLWVGTSTTDQFGYGTYVDSNFDPQAPGYWYEIVYIDTVSGIHGCHSEPISPTAMEVTDFKASFDSEAQSVNLTWTTMMETNIQGFNLYRSEGVNGARIKLNGELIQALNAGTPDGATYPLTDTAVEVGRSYNYWLEVRHLDGTTYTLMSNEVMLGMKLYIPLIQR